jgi:hypothetical protein
LNEWSDLFSKIHREERSAIGFRKSYESIMNKTYFTGSVSPHPINEFSEGALWVVP